jgi:hypothetical protein
VDVISSHARGQVGISEVTSYVRVFVEKRLFRELNVPFGLPLIAHLDLGADQCSETFDEIPVQVASKIISDVVRAAPRLLVAIGNELPDRLGDVGATRRLLAWATADLGDEARKQLCAIEGFKTIQGTRVSLETAWHPHKMLRTAAWQDEWLGPSEGEAQTTLDEPILALAAEDTELRTVIDKLPEKAAIDVTDDVLRLQANRRMARGLIPTPKVTGVPPELKRTLAELGDAGKDLGHGELALVDGDQSTIMLHSQGRFVRSVPINVQPPVALAIEDHAIAKPEQLRDIQRLVNDFLGEHPVTHAVRELAVELVSQVLATPARSMLTPRMLRNLARAVWARRIFPKVLGDLAAFETLDHAWVPWATIVDQNAQFGDVWSVTEWTDERPLDERRVVLLATKEDIENTKHHNVKLIEAREELRLDGVARRNRALPLASSLALPTRMGILAEAELQGDGVSGTRGNVAILIPSIKGGRGVVVHRGMQPLGTMADPCMWPTIAVIDDARLTPDRTWSAAKQDQTWQAVVKQIRTASEELLATFGEAPPEALVSMRIDANNSAEIKELRKAGKSQMRGVVWLEQTPLAERTLQLTYELGVTTVRTTPVSGQLLLSSDPALDRQSAIEQLGGYAYGRLVRKLVGEADKHAGVTVQAHVAHALALDEVKPTEVRAIEFTCFVPSALEPRTLVGLLRRHHVVYVVDPGEASPDGEIAVIDDGSSVSAVIKLHLGKRLRRAAVAVPPSPAPPQPVKVAQPDEPTPAAAKPAPKPADKPKPRKPEPEQKHPIQGLVELISKRVASLGLRGYEFRIAATRKPMFQFFAGAGYLFVAGDNERLRSLALHVDTSSPWLPAAIDALAAHVVSILNLALTDVTDAAEVDALQLLLSPRSASPPQSRRSS